MRVPLGMACTSSFMISAGMVEKSLALAERIFRRQEIT